jgi:hypothetical protein
MNAEATQEPQGEDPRAAGRRRALRAALGVLGLALACFLAWSALTRAERLGYGSPDDSMFIQLCWNTIDGAPLRFSHEAWEGAPDRSYYASHLNLLFVLYLPLFALSPGHQVFCLLKPFLTLLAGVPLYALARRRTGSDLLAAGVAVLFALHPLVGYNAVRLSSNYLTLFLLVAAFERLDRGALKTAGACFLLAVAGREEISLANAAFLIPLALLWPHPERPLPGDAPWRERLRAQLAEPRTRMALAVTAAGLLLTFGYVGVLKAQFGEGPDHFHRFAHLGSSLPAVALSPLLRPRAFWGNLLSGQSTAVLAALVIPLGPALFLAPRHLLAACASWGVIAISSVGGDKVLGPYLVPALPFLYVGLVEGLVWLGQRPRHPRRWQAAGLALAAASTALAWSSDSGPLSRYQGVRALSQRPLQVLAAVNPEYPQVQALTRLVPPEAKVSASPTTLLPLACRRYLYPFPIRAHEVDFVLVDRRADSPFNPRWPASTPAQHTASIQALLAEPGARLAEAGRFLLIDRREVQRPAPPESPR